MNKIVILALVLLIAIFLTGCGLPDLPGPIGIPGV